MIKELEEIASKKDLLTRKKYVMSLLTREAEKRKVTPIIVGGTAVDLYTHGLFPSRDIDVIGDRKIIGEILEKEFGFSRMGRHWGSEKLGIFIEVPGDYLSGERAKVAVMRVGALKLYIVGIEDLIIDRLNGCVHWKSDTDCKQAEYMGRYYRGKMDIEYLNTRAKKEGVSNRLTFL